MIRTGLNRLIVTLILAAALVLAVGVAAEAVYALLGRGGHLGPVDYRSAWRSMQDWNPSDATRIVIFGAVVLVGLALVALQAWPGRRDREVEIAAGEHGRTLLDAGRLRSHLRERIGRRDWIASSSPRVRLTGLVAEVRDRPRVNRPWLEAELAEVRESLGDDLRLLGLEPGAIDISPRRPAERDRRRPR